jgi:hypothetical protein
MEIKRMFGPKREEGIGGWRKLHSYPSCDKIKGDETGEVCNKHERGEKYMQYFV